MKDHEILWWLMNLEPENDLQKKAIEYKNSVLQERRNEFYGQLRILAERRQS